MKSCKCEEVAAAVYIRISTDEDLQKWSLGGQEKELVKLAQQRGWTVYRVYKDTVSGSKADRPGLNELRDDLADGKFSIILVVDQDRLSRMESVDWELFKTEIREAGVRIVTPASEVDFADEDSELVSDIFNLFARHQRRKLKKAMRRGRQEAVERGNWLGKAPYGRVKKQGSLYIDPVTGPVVLKIFELYGYENIGSFKIANYLNSLKILSPGGCSWDQTAVLRVLSNPVHRGEIEAFINGKEVKVRGVFEPTVPLELFDKCREILRSRQKENCWLQEEKVTSLAAEVLFCSKCHRQLNVLPIQTKYKKKVYTYYYYRHRKRRQGKTVKGDCELSFRVEQVDRRILRALQVICSGAGAFNRLIKLDTGAHTYKRLKVKLDTLKEAERIISHKFKRLVELYLNGDWEKPLLLEQKNALTGQLDHNRQEQQEVKEKLSCLSNMYPDTEHIAEYLALLKNIDFEVGRHELRRLIKSLFWHIELSEKQELHFTCRLFLAEEFYCHHSLKGI